MVCLCHQVRLLCHLPCSQVQVKIEDEIVSKGIDSGRLLIVNSGSDIPVSEDDFLLQYVIHA